VISEVDEICEFEDSNFEIQPLPKVKARIKQNYHRLVELQEQAGQALIWRYLKSTVDPTYNDQTLSALSDDRDLASWLLPIVRFRIEWLRQAAVDGRLREYAKKNPGFRRKWETLKSI
jgi:hypothetical protein